LNNPDDLSSVNNPKNAKAQKPVAQRGISIVLYGSEIF